MVSELLELSAMELAARIRQRRVSPVEVVEAHIARIEAANPRINAVVAHRFGAAREEARAAEAQVMATTRPDELPPLCGVPCTIKEFLAVAGLPWTAGVHARRDVRATEDSTVVERLRRAGAIVLGVTNVPEGGLWMETHNTLYGRTLNPWDVRRTAGGSSGGEAAIVAVGGSPFGIGADIGGSIRIPAAFCGVVGHKPTGRMVPNTGYWPLLDGDLSAYLVNGPITRRVADLWPILRLIAGPDGRDGVVRSWPLEERAVGEVDLREVTVYPLESNGRTRVLPVMRAAVTDAARALTDRGARVGNLRSTGIRHAFEMWSAMLAEAPGPSYAEVLGDGQPIGILRELGGLVLGERRHTAPALLLAGLEKLVKRLPGRIGEWARRGRQLQAELEAELGPRGVLLHPPYTRPAPPHHGPLWRPFDFVCTAIFNVLEFPVTQVPLGFDAGLPVGVQVAAIRGHDHLTIAVAAALEQSFGGWRWTGV